MTKSSPRQSRKLSGARSWTTLTRSWNCTTPPCAWFDIFTQRGRSHTAVSPAVLTIQIGDQELTFQPDDVLVAPTGERIFRVIKTGHKLDVKKDLGAGAHLVLVRGTDTTAVVEMVFLADGVTEKLDFSKTVVKNRHTTLTEILAGIRAGAFPNDRRAARSRLPELPCLFHLRAGAARAARKKILNSLTGLPTGPD